MRPVLKVLCGAIVLATVIACLGPAPGRVRAATPAPTGIAALTPSAVGANAATTVLITGAGFSRGDAVTIQHCPTTNPSAVYPVPFPNPGPGQGAGSVEFLDSSHLLMTTPTVIPSGTCDIQVGGATLARALVFEAAPARLAVEITNSSGRPDADVWISAGYNCPLAAPSPPYPPGVGGCDIDGRTNSRYSWPAGDGTDPNRYWYEVYRGADPLPAFSGIRLADLPAVAGRAHTFTLSVANIDSGVVYVSYGEPVNTGASVAGRAPSYLTSMTRFDVFELTFHGSGASSGDAGAGRWTSQVYANITAVAGLGILMDMSGYDNGYGVAGPDPQRVGSGIHWQDGLGVGDVYRALAGAGADIADRHLVVTSDGAAPNAANFLRFVSPSTNEGAGYADLGAGADSYLHWLGDQGRAMTMVGLYAGAGPGQGTWFCYRTTPFSAINPTRMTGAYGFATRAAAATASEHQCMGGTPGPVITTATTPTSGTPGPVTSAAIYLQDNRYLQDGSTVAGNDLANAVYRDFIVSFAYGFWGSLAGEAGWTTRSWSADAAPAFSAAWPRLADPMRFPRWDAYAGAIWRLGNAYGMPYSDTFDNAGKGNPLVSGSAIHSLRVILRPDGDWGTAPALLPARQRVIAHRGVRFRSEALTALGFAGSARFTIAPRVPTSRSRAINGIWFDRRRGSLVGTPTRLHAATTYAVTGRDRLGHAATAAIRLVVVR